MESTIQHILVKPTLLQDIDVVVRTWEGSMPKEQTVVNNGFEYKGWDPILAGIHAPKGHWTVFQNVCMQSKLPAIPGTP
jgi:hypothetical protein